LVIKCHSAWYCSSRTFNYLTCIVAISLWYLRFNIWFINFLMFLWTQKWLEFFSILICLHTVLSHFSFFCHMQFQWIMKVISQWCSSIIITYDWWIFGSFLTRWHDYYFADYCVLWRPCSRWISFYYRCASAFQSWWQGTNYAFSVSYVDLSSWLLLN
jgi:hypothetical protein